MQKPCLSDDSDSDSLPDPRTKFYPPPSKTFNPGDIVWAKFRYLYWPALVRACYLKENKISIWYCDDPGKTFKIPLKNIYSFRDKEMSLKIRQDAKAAGVLKEHEGLTSHAISYLRRKAKGYKDDPMKFFDQTYPFFLAEEMLKKDPNANLSDIKIRPMYISHDKKMTVRMSVKNCPKIESNESEIESEDSDCDDKKCTNDYLSEINVRLQKNINDSTKEIDIDAVLKYILSGKVDNYLKKIKSKEITSEYHSLFEHSVKSKGKNVSKVTYTGPINDNSKLRKLIFYLLPLYEKTENALKNKCTSVKKHKTSSSSTDYRKIRAQYVASVFLPESIIFAISKIKNISLTKAKKLFDGKSVCKTKAVEKILKRVDQRCVKKDINSRAIKYPGASVSQVKKQCRPLKKNVRKAEITTYSDKSSTVYNKVKKAPSDSKSNKDLKLNVVVK